MKKALYLILVLALLAIFPASAFADDPPAAPNIISATTNDDGTIITLTFDKEMADPSADAGSFDVYATGYYYGSVAGTSSYTIDSAALATDTTMIELLLDDPVQRGDKVSIDYTPGSVTAADDGVLEAFWGVHVDNVIPVEIVSNLEGSWQVYDHVGNWGEESYPIGDDSRGNIYNRHIVIDGAEVTFYGYGAPAFKDFLFLPSEDTAAKGFDFNMDTSQIDFHAMEGGGFLFNAQIVGGVLSGYCVLVQGTYGSYSNFVQLYEITGVDIDSFRDEDYDGLSGLSGVEVLGPSYPLVDAASRSIHLETSANSVSMWDGDTQIINNFKLTTEYGNGIGVIASHISHGCSSLSIFKFSDLSLNNLADLQATLSGTTAKLQFTDISDADGVTVEQSTDGVNFTPAHLRKAIDVDSTSATVIGLDPYTTYYFRLVIDGGIYDGYSRVATAEFTPSPISDLTATGADRSVKLTFTAPHGADGVIVLQSTDDMHFVEATTKAVITGTSTTATVTGLKNGQKYYFLLLVDGGAFAGVSNEVSATPKSSGGGGGGGGGTVAIGSSNMLRFILGNTDSFVKYGASGELLKPMDVTPMVKNNRTFLPIRYVAGPLGGTIFWDAALQQVTVVRGDTTIKLWIGKNTATVNGVSKMIDPNNPEVVPMIVAPGRVFLPIRFISEALGCTVTWEASSQQIFVTNW